MSFELWTPPPLETPIHECTEDWQRKINGKCWDLAKIQKALGDGELNIELSGKAQAQMIEELLWSPEDLIQFINCLHKGRYNDSEWCLPSNNPIVPPMKADSYVIGFNRFKGEENQAAEPWIYFKFAIKEKAMKLIVFSLHHSIY